MEEKAIAFSDLDLLTISGRLGRKLEYKVAGNGNPMATPGYLFYPSSNETNSQEGVGLI